MNVWMILMGIGAANMRYFRIIRYSRPIININRFKHKLVHYHILFLYLPVCSSLDWTFNKIDNNRNKRQHHKYQHNIQTQLRWSLIILQNLRKINIRLINPGNKLIRSIIHFLNFIMSSINNFICIFHFIAYLFIYINKLS